MATSHTKTHMSLFIVLLVTLISLASSARVLSNGAQPSVHEILKQYGLPNGLLPDSVTSYTFNVDDNSFVVELKKPCYIKFDYLVYYDTKITGKLSVGALTGLSGIKVQSFFLWLNVDEIKADLQNSNSISFTMGVISKNLDIKQFETIHSCKDNALAACDQSSDVISKLPVPMLSHGAQPSVHEILKQFGLPSGLLPDSVTSYTFNPDNSFVLELKKPCYIKFDYLVYYDTKITGKLSFGTLTGLSGIKVQSFFLWLNVDEIKVDLQNSNSISFTMGVISKNLDIKQFETIHSCKDNALTACDQSSDVTSKLPARVLSLGAQPSVHEILKQFGLPSGLLPDSVTSYTFNPDNSFVLELKKPCYIKFDYLVYYDTKITGKLSFGALTGLSGIKVQSFFIWLNVDEIKVDLQNSNSISFTMGVISKNLDIKQFETIHSCKDNALAACDESSNLISKLSIAVDEVETLVTV